MPVLTLDAHGAPRKARQFSGRVCLLHELVAIMTGRARLEGGTVQKLYRPISRASCRLVAAQFAGCDTLVMLTSSPSIAGNNP
jgi:hypothetical protein